MAGEMRWLLTYFGNPANGSENMNLSGRRTDILELVKRLSLHTSKVAHQVGAHPGFLSIKRLRVLLLRPGWDASPTQGYPQH